MDINRLANIIFEKGQKISLTKYNVILEKLDDDKFTLLGHVAAYKNKDSVLGTIPFLLEDGTKILISEEMISKLNTLDIDKVKLEEYMSTDISNFKKVIGTVLDGS